MGDGADRRSAAIGLLAATLAVAAATALNVTSSVTYLFLITPIGAVELGALLLVRRSLLLPVYLMMATASATVALTMTGWSVGDVSFYLAVAVIRALVLLPIALVLRRDRDWLDGTCERTEAWMRFLLLGVLVGPAAQAWLQSVARVLLDVGPVPWAVFWSYSLTNQLTFALAALILVPAMLRLRPAALGLRRRGLALTGLAMAGLTTALMMQDLSVLLFALPIPLTVMAVRHGAVGATLAALVAVPVTLGLTRLGYGPFVAATPSLQTAMILAQVFLALMMATNLAVMAALDQRDATADRLRHDDLEDLRRAADTDGLTGLANRRRFDRDLAAVWQSAAVRGEPVSLLILDVDEFKSYNDRFGHPAGDRVLVEVAGAIRSTLRTPTDLPARYGGEEFVVLLPRTGLAEASRVAERIRRAVGLLAVVHDRSAHGVLSISVGVASARPDYQPTDHAGLLAEADAALYRAKRGGRNRVECA